MNNTVTRFLAEFRSPGWWWRLPVVVFYCALVQFLTGFNLQNWQFWALLVPFSLALQWGRK